MDFPLHDMDDHTFMTRFGSSRMASGARHAWMPSDTAAAWDANQSDRAARTRIVASGWTRDSITYRYNNHGFRSDDDYHPGASHTGNIFLGCSITEGIGLNIEDTWAYRLCRLLGGEFYNLAQAATGIETQYRMLKAWAPALRPRAVFTLGAIGPRREILRTGEPPLNIGPWLPTSETGDTERALLSEDDHAVSTQRTLDAMRYVAIGLGIPLYMPRQVAIDRALRRMIDEESYARDAVHPGRAYHEELARSMEDWRRIA